MRSDGNSMLYRCAYPISPLPGHPSRPYCTSLAMNQCSVPTADVDTSVWSFQAFQLAASLQAVNFKDLAPLHDMLLFVFPVVKSPSLLSKGSQPNFVRCAEAVECQTQGMSVLLGSGCSYAQLRPFHSAC